MLTNILKIYFIYIYIPLHDEHVQLCCSIIILKNDFMSSKIQFFLFNVKKITTNVSVKIGGDKMKDLSLLCDSFKVCLLKAVGVTSITLSERCPLSAT